ncbi:MAG: Ig-like domain-containing protein [Gemmatimonadetes bacterium]|nr:Ig-like domain-containing protein [Gemmatimonadota bacterium]
MTMRILCGVVALSLALAACGGSEVTSDQTPLGGSGVRGSTNSGGDTTVTPPQTGGAVASVTIVVAPMPGGRKIVKGDSLGFSAILKDANGVTLNGRSITWTAANPEIVRLDWSSGSYAIGRAVAAGTAVITATSEGKSGSATVEVQ